MNGGWSRDVEHAIWNRDMPLLAALLKQNDVAAIDEEGLGYVHLCVSIAPHSCDTVRVCVEGGCPVDTAMECGTTPLVAASLHGCATCVSLLIANGASVNHQLLIGDTPLSSASAWGNASCVDALLDNGASPDIAVGEDGDLPLHFAAQSRSVETVRSLLSRGVFVDEQNRYGETALMKATLAGDEGMVGFLLSQGARRELQTARGRTAQDMAVELGFKTIAAMLSNENCAE